MPGTCEWILSNPAFKSWSENTPESRIAWVNAPPASGKSILSAYIINYMHESNLNCQYFFFKFADQTKRSTTALLKSVGLQMANDFPAYRREIVKLSHKGVTLQKKDARFIWQKIFTGILSQIVLSKPLYWVFDALDESDSPKLVLELLQNLAKLSTPIRVLVISRETESLSRAFDRLSAHIPISTIQWNNQQETTSDIQVYIENELKYMRGAEDLKLEVKQDILNRADGNFLWVHLVLEEVLGCHTQEAISKTLEEIPTGMSALYQRMELTMSTNTREADKVLAKTLLTWVVCAHHPLSLKELSEALKPIFPEFLDLKRTILDVCGQFIIVDRNWRAVLVHKTARDFLITQRDTYFHIDENMSHKELFAHTISHLMRPDLRAKLGRSREDVRSANPFLLYAATNFTYHLRQAAITSEEMMDTLILFLKASSVLTWIYLLAEFRHLEVLVTAAGVLAWFAGLNRKLNAEKNPLLHRVQDLELYDTWATDLTKVVAKFGRYLLDDPASIYTIVPALCPQSSAIFQQFARSESSALSVRGISDGMWNDCLARVSLRHSAKAWKIACVGCHIAVLSSTGSIVLWNSVNFEEICTMRHAELVTQMCFNSKCDRLVSYGYKTTKIWAIPSGQLIANVINPNSSRALTITFAENDAKVLIGSEDEKIRQLRIDEVGEGWHTRDLILLQEKHAVEGGIITSPSYMLFNPGASRIAVAYRGYPLSVWDTKEPRLIGRCKRVAQHRPNDGRPSIGWMAVDRVAWNPISDHLVGVYKDGCIFKWNPIDDEYQEVAMVADEIQVSPDGKLFLTSDSNGTVKVWNFAFFSVIYQLSSENLVSGLAFSPDCKRFYDLRENSINAWEPNSLIRASENSEMVSDTASDYQTIASKSQMSEAWIVSIDPIIALAAASTSMLFCVSHEDGSINLFDKNHGELMEIAKFSAFLAVDHLTWGKDGMHVAIADVGGSIMVKRLEPVIPDTTSNFRLQTLFTGKAKIPVGGIHQILLDESSTKLLLVSQDFGQIWSIEAGKMVYTATLEKGETRRWMNHPLLKDHLLGVGPRDLKVISWEDLTEVASQEFQEDRFHIGGRPSSDTDEVPGTPRSRLSMSPDTGLAEDLEISKAMISQDGKYLLVQLSRHISQGRSVKVLLVFEASFLRPSHGVKRHVRVLPLDIPESITTRVEIPLQVLRGGTLVFLDKDLWMCSFRLESFRQPNALKRHYFIPRDWASTESLEQCCMLRDATFLLPKDGEVAIINSDLGDAGW